MPITKVRSKWSDGDLVFTDASGTEIARFDAANAALDIKTFRLNGSAVTATAEQLNGVTSTLEVANNTGGPLTAGTLVYLTGAYDTTNGVPNVAVSSATQRATHVLLEDIADGETGTADGEATVTGLDTSGAGAAGDPVYLAAAGGFGYSALTGADQISQVVGMVITKHATTGSVLFIPGAQLITAVGTSALQASAVSTAKIADAAVTAAKWSDGAGVAALVSAGLGASAAYTKATDGVQDLAAADPSARACIVVVTVTEVFADGDGGQPTFTIGDESTADSIMAAAKLTDAAAGTVLAFAGQITAAEKLQVTASAGTGTTETGAISVVAILLPES